MGFQYNQISIEERCEIARLRTATNRRLFAPADRCRSGSRAIVSRSGAEEKCFRLDRDASLRERVVARGAQGWSAQQVTGRLTRETGHADMITQQVYDGLSRLSLERKVPIINEVLPVTDIGHAEERARDDKFNKGKEAAVAAAEMAAWRRSVG